MARRVGAPGRPSLARSAASQLCGCSRGPSPPSLMGLILLTLMAHSRLEHPGAVSGRGRAVGVGNPDACQDRRLQALHLLGSGTGFMVVAKQVEQAVHDEMLEMMRRLDRLLLGFAQDGLCREDDVPQIGTGRGWPAGRPLKWKGKDVGSSILAAIA